MGSPSKESLSFIYDFPLCDSTKHLTKPEKTSLIALQPVQINQEKQADYHGGWGFWVFDEFENPVGVLEFIASAVLTGEEVIGSILLFWKKAMGKSSGDIIVSLLVAVLLEKLALQELRDFGLAWCVLSELDELSIVLESIQGMLSFAEQVQTKNHMVKNCLRNLRESAYRVEDILDEFIYAARKEKDERYLRREVSEVRFLDFNLNANGLLHKEEIVPLVDELIKKLVEIEKKLEVHYYNCRGLEIWQSHGVNHELMDTRPKSGSLVDESFIFGRKEDVDEIKNKLLSYPGEINQKPVSVIAIVGLGGVGKTTLAQLVYNDPDVQKHFERRAWVCVSTDFNAVRLTSAIIESLTRRNPNLSNLEPLQCELRDEIRGKRFLIVLDDVWTENDNDWQTLRVAFMAAEEGSRIIVTTRSRRVSSKMCPMYNHDLQILSDEDCWSIMKAHISMDHGSIAPNLEAVGRNIARECKGLPLAARTLAGLLHCSSDLDHWQSVLNSCMLDLEESNLPAALSLSYYFLPTHLKQCFAYCSVFPKGYKFDKQHLIQLWVAERFIRSNTRMKDKGGQYFDELLHRSFFQLHNENRDRFVMHDLVHDLAQAMSGEVYGRFECVKSGCCSKETRYLSICCVKYMFKDKTHDHKRLSTLINLNLCYCLGKYNFLESFGGLKYLRVLHLNGIWMLPDDIGNLKYLHYINLSYARIHQLPKSLCDLLNLQSLILRRSIIRELPRDMKYLLNLQHLDISECHYLRSMPQGIGRLSGLKTLSKFPVSKDDGCGIRELKGLHHLEGALSICSLQNVINPLDAREADLMNKPKVDELELTWGGTNGDRDVEVLEGLQPHTELKSLRIHNYHGSTFPKWLMIALPSYRKLVTLTLSSCSECRVLPPIGELPLLESLYIKHMPELQKSSMSRGKETEFPSLQKLTIETCCKLRILPQPLLSSPRLRELRINDCPKLRLLPHEGLSKLISLEDLYLGDNMEGLVQSLDEIETLPPNLNRFYINQCKLLPKGMRNLSSLKHLEFGPRCRVNYSPEELPTGAIVTRDW